MTDLFAFTDEMRRLMDRAVAHAGARINHEVESLQSPPDASVLDRALAGAVTAGGIGPGGGVRPLRRRDRAELPGGRQSALPGLRRPSALDRRPDHGHGALGLVDLRHVVAGSSRGDSGREPGTALVGGSGRDAGARRWCLPERGDRRELQRAGGGASLLASLKHPGHDRRLGVAMTAEAHASAKMVARVLDFEIVPVEGDDGGD